ncbi:MAG: hypothetical protein WCW43_01170, partial [Candidatus Paceibacterota bacterium]
FFLVVLVILAVIIVVQTSKKPEVKPAVSKAQLSAVTNCPVVKKRGNENPDGSVTLSLNLKDLKLDGLGKK